MSLNSTNSPSNATHPKAQIVPPAWRFWLALLFQTSLILAIPARAVYTYLSGTTAILQTQPLNPDNFLSGSSRELRYEISSIDKLRTLPGWESLVRQTSGSDPSIPRPGTQFYVLLEAPDENTTNPPQPWEAIAVRLERPPELPDNRVALQGVFEYDRVDYGLQLDYLPEEKRDRMNARIDRLLATTEEPRSLVIEVKIDSRGEAVPVGFWLGKRNYQF